MKRSYRIAGLAVGLVATAASAYFMVQSWQGQDLGAYASPRALAGMGIAVAFYVAGVMVSALAWRRLLAGCGDATPWLDLSGIVAVTQIGKYLPGNVAQHIGRVALALGRGIGPAPLVVTGVLEVALLALASVVVGGSALLLSGHLDRLGTGGDTWTAAAVVAVATLVVIAFLAGPRVLRRHGSALVARLAPSLGGAAAKARLPAPAAVGSALVLYALVYVIFGIGIVLMARLLVGAGGDEAWLLVASFCLAWIVGFATPGAPAGLGVREAVMLLFLAGAYPPADASAIVLALRLATTFGDIVLLPIGWWQLRIAGSGRVATPLTGEPPR